MKVFLLVFNDGTKTYLQASSLAVLEKIINKENVKSISEVETKIAWVKV